MPIKPPVASERDRSKALEEWIDGAVSAGRPAVEVAAEIARLSMPGTTTYLLTPEFFGGEGWFWPWNRAGFLYIDRGRHGEAASVFTCAYLAALRIQHAGQFRIHKGMPLCNISYSHLGAGAYESARLPALLGMVEDAITSGKPAEAQSFNNLMASGFPESMARSLGGFFLFANRDPGITPLYPEATLDCAQRGNAFVSPDCIAAMQAVAGNFTPNTIEDSLAGLTRAWERFRPILTMAANWRPGEHGQPAAAAFSRPDAASGGPNGPRRNGSGVGASSVVPGSQKPNGG